MKFYKYHGLGNDYIVLDPEEFGKEIDEIRIRLICHRNYGVGSDGILFGPIKNEDSGFALRIFNPDGSEAEKSGNGLRIFSRFLWDKGLVREEPFRISTLGGNVMSQVLDEGEAVKVEMGRVSFQSDEIPVAGPKREVLNETLNIDGQDIYFCAAGIGNPHCVIIRDKAIAEEAKKWGPIIETDTRFPNKINVQFMEILDRNNIKIEIWERGAGYTLASGSSSSASAAVAYKLDKCDSQIMVHMPGGEIEIDISEDYSIIMTGSVKKIAEGTLSLEMFNQEC